MKRMFWVIVVVIACCAMIFTSCKKEEKKTEEYVYTLGRDVSMSMEHFSMTGSYISEKGYEVGANKVIEGASVSECDSQARAWFENSIGGINSDELCGMMSEGEYIKLHVYRSDDGDAVIVEEREYKGTQE